MTVLATVRNTGSHTIHNILSPLGQMHFLTEDIQADDRFWFGHCESENLSLIELRMILEPPLILAMRDPIEVARSWIRRSKTLDHTFVSMWNNLFALKTSYGDSFWLPVDTPDRDAYLDAIEARIGVELNRDWTRKGVFTAQNYQWSSGMTVAEAREFLMTLPFGQFGYDFGLDRLDQE